MNVFLSSLIVSISFAFSSCGKMKFGEFTSTDGQKSGTEDSKENERKNKNAVTVTETSTSTATQKDETDVTQAVLPPGQLQIIQSTDHLRTFCPPPRCTEPVLGFPLNTKFKVTVSLGADGKNIALDKEIQADPSLRMTNKNEVPYLLIRLPALKKNETYVVKLENIAFSYLGAFRVPMDEVSSHKSLVRQDASYVSFVRNYEGEVTDEELLSSYPELRPGCESAQTRHQTLSNLYETKSARAKASLKSPLFCEVNSDCVVRTQKYGCGGKHYISSLLYEKATETPELLQLREQVDEAKQKVVLHCGQEFLEPPLMTTCEIIEYKGAVCEHNRCVGKQ